MAYADTLYTLVIQNNYYSYYVNYITILLKILNKLDIDQKIAIYTYNDNNGIIEIWFEFESETYYNRIVKKKIIKEKYLYQYHRYFSDDSEFMTVKEYIDFLNK